MNKFFKIFLVFMILISLFSVVYSGEKQTNKPALDSKSGKTLYEERIIGEDKQDELIFKDQKLIKMSIAIFEVKPSDTINLKKSELVIGKNQKCTLTFASGFQGKRQRIDYEADLKKEILKIYITPVIVDGKGVEMEIETTYIWASKKNLKEPIVKENKVKTKPVRNSEQVVVELLNNKEKGKKILLSIVPNIETIHGPKRYPGLVRYQLDTPILIMNDELIYRNTKSPDFLSVISSDKDAGMNCFINYFINKDNIGDFILSVKPFKGSKKIGIVENKVLKFKYGNNFYELISLESILPLEGRWIVYGRYFPVNKVKGVKLERHPFAKGKGGVKVLCTKNIYGQELFSSY